MKTFRFLSRVVLGLAIFGSPGKALSGAAERDAGTTLTVEHGARLWNLMILPRASHSILAAGPRELVEVMNARIEWFSRHVAPTVTPR